MLIGELSNKTRVSRDTIRYYEKIGLLKPVSVRRENSYKEYSADAVEILKIIAVGKNLGFKLTETKEFLTFWEQDDMDNEELNKMVLKKIDEIDAKIKALLIFKQNLQNALVKCEPDKL